MFLSKLVVLPPQPTDTELVRDCITGNEGAWKTLYTRHFPDAYYAARRVVLSILDAEDIAQNVFIALQPKLATLREPEKIAGYLKRAAYHAAIDFIRAHPEKRRKEISSEYEAEISDDSEKMELNNLLHEAAKVLSGNERRVIEAIIENPTLFNDDHTLSELLATKQNSVHTARMRGVEKFRRELERLGVTPKTHVPK